MSSGVRENPDEKHTHVTFSHLLPFPMHLAFTSGLIERKNFLRHFWQILSVTGSTPVQSSIEFHCILINIISSLRFSYGLFASRFSLSGRSSLNSARFQLPQTD